ncbi:hypothetical protein PU560_17460 [Georgenia sp. 10Sc9-8]|uniref:Uncharacterized protein n=1 Tax=Georgenia halotolerans TaxID=3028317 RepID=A0ABT5U1M3_9MICO|nr:hypothetical protein [Georgenia halotolerans]
MTTLTPLPAVAVLYFLYVGATEGFTGMNVTLLLVAVVLFVLSLKRTGRSDRTDKDEDATAGG